METRKIKVTLVNPATGEDQEYELEYECSPARRRGRDRSGLALEPDEPETVYVTSLSIPDTTEDVSGQFDGTELWNLAWQDLQDAKATAAEQRADDIEDRRRYGNEF